MPQLLKVCLPRFIPNGPPSFKTLPLLGTDNTIPIEFLHIFGRGRRDIDELSSHSLLCVAQLLNLFSKHLTRKWASFPDIAQIFNNYLQTFVEYTAPNEWLNEWL